MTNRVLSMNQFEQLIGLTRDHMRDSLFVYKATSSTGDTCHFGIESAAKAWAKGGTVEAIKVREFKLHTSSPTAAPVGEWDDHVPEIAARLRLVAKLAGCPNAVPEKDTTAVGAIFSVLGHIRMALESKSSAQVEVNELPKLPEADGYKFEAKGISKIDVSPHGGAWFPLYSQKKLEAYARAALSAGDAVDGPLIDEGSKPALSPLSDKDAIALIEEHTNDDNVLHAHEAIELIRSVERAHGIDAAMRKGQL